jgi:aspartate racemase
VSDDGGADMKWIGLLGGMSWTSTAQYYRLLNQGMQRRLGGHHSAKTILVSVDFDDIERLQRAEAWTRAGELLADAARRLERAGADCVVLATNTMHKVAPAIEAAVGIPLLHIADSTARPMLGRGFSRVALLGTRFTMEQDFYRDRLVDRFGIQVTVPGEADRAMVHRVIYDELCHGHVSEDSKAEYMRLLRRMAEDGLQAVIFGCTEISLLVDPFDCPLPVFDTTALHAEAALDFALEDLRSSAAVA